MHLGGVFFVILDTIFKVGIERERNVFLNFENLKGFGESGGGRLGLVEKFFSNLGSAQRSRIWLGTEARFSFG